VVTLVRLALDPILGDRLPYILYFPVLMAVVWYLRTGPTLVALAASATAAHFLFMSGAGVLRAEAIQILVFILAVGFMAVVAGSARAARGAAEEASAAARREMEERSAHEEAYRTSFELAAVGKAQMDPGDGRFLRVNGKLAEITGYLPEELLSRSLDELTHADDLETSRSSFDRVLAGRQREHAAQLRLVRKDGLVVWVQVNAAIVRDRRGNPVRTIAVLQDITAHRMNSEALVRLKDELEDRVRERTAQLEAVNRELESFSYSVSHDLRAPLRHIAGFAELLDRHGRERLDTGARRHLDSIVGAARRAGRLVDELLGFARMSRTAMQTQRVDMAGLVAQARAELEEPHVPRFGGVQWHIGEVPQACGDPAMLRQVWANLLSNAVKYSAPSGAPEVHVRGETLDDEVVYSVSDNGIGFDMQYADKLFGIFQRLHSDDRFEGTGIGLANVRRIVQRHGGRTWAEGKPGAGATFYFSLPHVEDEAGEATSTAGPAQECHGPEAHIAG
jgi:PAS domain S-box-containing protein